MGVQLHLKEIRLFWCLELISLLKKITIKTTHTCGNNHWVVCFYYCHNENFISMGSKEMDIGMSTLTSNSISSISCCLFTLSLEVNLNKGYKLSKKLPEMQLKPPNSVCAISLSMFIFCIMTHLHPPDYFQ